MAKIIRLDTSKERRMEERTQGSRCDHRWVTAATASRTVYCTTCGTPLDPFDVLLEVLKGCIPPEKELAEEKRLLREVKKREKAEDDGGVKNED